MTGVPLAMKPFVDYGIPVAARTYVILGVILGAAFSGMTVVFVGAQILTDPGGWQGVGIVSAWLVVPLALSVLAFLRPDLAFPVIAVMVGLVLAASVATIPIARTVWEFEDTHGPINLMVLIGALIPLITLGRSRPRQAGRLLVVFIAGFVISQGVSLGLVDQWSVLLVFAVLLPPYIAAAVLFVMGGRIAAQSASFVELRQQAR